jgi:hypothetical protein
LRVVWEIEPGARIYETRWLPDPTGGCDEPAVRIKSWFSRRHPERLAATYP